MAKRDLTQIREYAAIAVKGHKMAVAALEKIVELAGRDDARELKPRPSLRKRPKKARR